MRDLFHQELDSLTSDISVLCDAAGEAMRHATEALLNSDLQLAEQVVGDRDHVAAEAHEVGATVYRLLALQSPVASDLRAVVTSMQNAADAERMAALALHVAEAARRRHPRRAVPEELRGVFEEMGAIAVRMGSAAADLVLSSDADQAERIAHEDERMDALHRNLFTVVLDTRWSHGVTAAVDVTLLSRFYERFADHSVDISRRAVIHKAGLAGSSLSRGTLDQEKYGFRCPQLLTTVQVGP